MARWLLKSGIHSDRRDKPIQLNNGENDGGIPGIGKRELSDWDGIPKDQEPPVFYAGDVFESDQDLGKLNARGVERRFEKLSETPGPVDELDSKTIKELMEIAEEEEWDDIPKGIKHDALVLVIRGRMMTSQALASG